VDEELNRLPDRMRMAFVLCCLEGMTSAEAARELGCPVGTVDSRLHAARARLRERLTRRGFGPGALAGLILVAPPATSVATAVGAGSGVAPSPAVGALAGHVCRILTRKAMTMKAVTAAVFAVAFTGAVLAFGGSGDVPPPLPKAAPPGVPAAQPPVAPVGPVAAGPRQPGGVLGHDLGTYLTIEGVKAEGVKIAPNTLLVDTVNGKKLDRPVPILVRFCDFDRNRFDLETLVVMPVGVRCVYKGFESGTMMGVPQAVSDAARELGRTDVPMSPVAWQWRTHFVALIEVKPEAKK
jgi:hypothetical protein